MTQKEFVEKLYDSKRFKDKEHAKMFLELFLDIFKESLVKNEKIIFKNFGTFSLREFDKNVYIPAKKKIEEKEGLKNIKFKMSNNLKKELKERKPK